MVQFRRNYVAVGTDFFTLTLQDRRSRILTDHVGQLKNAFRDVRKSHPLGCVDTDWAADPQQFDGTGFGEPGGPAHWIQRR